MGGGGKGGNGGGVMIVIGRGLSLGKRGESEEKKLVLKTRDCAVVKVCEKSQDERTKRKSADGSGRREVMAGIPRDFR